MINVLHIIDSKIPGSMLGQLSLLGCFDNAIGGGSGRIICLGPRPAGLALDGAVVQEGSTIFPDRISSALMLKKFPAPQLVHVWSANALPLALELGKGFSRPVLLSLPSLGDGKELEVAKGCDFLTVTIPCQSCKDTLLSSGLASDRVCILPAAAEKLPADDDFALEARQSLGIVPGMVVICAPGEVVRDANHKLAIWTQGILENMGVDVQLLIPSGGRFLPFVRRFSRSIGSQIPNIITGGAVDNKTILAASDIALFAGLRFPDAPAVAECMGASLPIIARKTVELDQIVTAGASLPIADIKPSTLSARVLQLIEDIPLRSRLAKEAGNICRQRYNTDLCKQALAGIYSNIRDQKKPVSSA